MKFNFTKITLPALLLAASTSAYAQGEGPILLKAGQGSPVTWEQYANVIANPSSLAGSADSTALHEKRVAYLGANGLGDGKVAEGENAGAKYAAAQAAQAVTDAQNEYDEADHNVTLWQGQIASWNSQIQKLNKQVNDSTVKRGKYEATKNAYGLELRDWQDSLKTLNTDLKELNNASMKVAGWLQDAYDAASDVKTNYKGSGLASVTLWYDYYYNEDENESFLYLYFGEEQPLEEPTTGGKWEQISAPDLFAKFKKGGTQETPNEVLVYLGKTDGKFNYGTNGYLPATFNSGNAIMAGVVTALQGLVDSDNIKYKEPDPNANSEQKQQINGKITAVNTKIGEINGFISTAQGLIDAIDAKVEELNASIGTYQGQIDELQPELDKLTTKDENGVTGLTKLYNAITSAKSAQTTADNAATTAKNEFEAALSAYNKAVEESSAAALADYKDVVLNADVVATSTIANLPQGYRIDGQNHIITMGQGLTQIFDTFSGSLMDAAVNGKFAKQMPNATFTSVVNWNGTSGAIYPENGIRSKTYTDFGEFGYALSNTAGLEPTKFGVNFSNGNVVAADDAPSKVLSLTVYDLDKNTQSYVQEISDKLYTRQNNAATAYTIPVNRFAKSNDANDYAAGLGLTNVFYGANNTCENVAIVDQEDFYCPVTVDAENVTLNRTFNAGFQTVCLPFELNYDLNTNIQSICDYDRADSETFWFTRIDEGSNLAANTPALIYLGDAVTKLEFSGVAIASTPKNQIITGNGMVPENSKTYGTFKKANKGQIFGQSQSNYIYGLNKNGKFQAGSDAATFPAFRMVIWSNVPQSNLSVPTANGEYIDIKGIGIHDQYGNDITNDHGTAGIGDIEADASAFSVVGGQGVITITAGADFGKVNIYNLNGMLIEVADVVEGTTTVNVAKGMYFVNGTKVLVK